MRLYSGTSEQFILDTVQNQIAERLRLAFFDYFRYYPQSSQIRAWQNSLRALSQVFQLANLTDNGVILEYQIPLTSKRIDCLICGQDTIGKDHAVIIELKQWEKCEPSEGPNEVVTWEGGGMRDRLHPSVQADRYRMFLGDGNSAFYEGPNPIILNSCAYLHNHHPEKNDPLLDAKFQEVEERTPLFTADEVNRMCAYLLERLERGNGTQVLARVEGGRERASKKLMDHIGRVIKGKSEYVLLDEQLVVYDKIRTLARKGAQLAKPTIVVVKGGPGTGKSVIALNLMADLSLEGINAQYATGSRAFTETLRKIIGVRGSTQFKYFNSFTQAEKNVVDVLICDEAHRLRETSNGRWTRRDKRSDQAQIEELMHASNVIVFFIDDNQIVRPNEIGSVAYIRSFAKKHDFDLIEFELEAQFRCNGSDAFVNWINNTLAVKRTANVIWDQHDEFDFKIFGSPEELEEAIMNKHKQGYSARLTAGFCWPWSMPDENGLLLNDIVIGEFKRPWDARPEAKKLAKGIPKASLWAYDPNGINQIGCIYTAQGFEFDYVGVIIGEDLVYNFEKQTWEGHPEKSSDSMAKRSKEQYLELVKNTYRVLLTRGMKGCYVFFIDKDTEKFVRSRIDIDSRTIL